MADAPRPAREDEDEGRDRVDRFVLVFVRESTLWPILIVIVGHMVVFIAPVMLIAARELRPSALVAMAVLVWLSVNLVRYDRRRAGRLSQLTALALVVWTLSVVTAVAAHWYGIF